MDALYVEAGDMAKSILAGIVSGHARRTGSVLFWDMFDVHYEQVHSQIPKGYEVPSLETVRSFVTENGLIRRVAEDIEILDTVAA